ncbi:MAG: cyclic nucleotide-binding domain-containing protein [Verrucomicrobia bacterium]|nr:cyclic nucleotide-binding domain-containing protein [Verrucomicrobiota bacterium]
MTTRNIGSFASRSLEILKMVSLFQGLTDEQIADLSSVFRRKIYPMGSFIITEGSGGDFLFVLSRGAAKVTRESEEGREVIFAFLKKGDVFGELSILDGRERSANIVTLEETEVYILDRNEFVKFMAGYPAISVHLLQELARRIRASDRQIEYLALKDSESRVLLALGRLAEESEIVDKNRLIIELKLPMQQDLASMAGTSRETVSRVLKSLEQKGMITRSVGKVQLYDFQDFQEFSEQFAEFARRTRRLLSDIVKAEP